MYVKIINPATNGKKAYANTGSARRTTNYLEIEAKENGQDPRFFSREEKGELSGDEVVALLDNNHKGLGKDAAKFYSLVLSPSKEELAELGGGDQALTQYTRQVMDLYAKNFTLKSGKELGEPDLVWAATIHHERKNWEDDEGIQGESKAGLQTHVHVIVSARDAEQKITLNPMGTASRFNRVQFQAQANTQLEELLGREQGVEAGTKSASRGERVRQKAEEIQQRAAANRQQKPLTPEQIAAKNARLEGQMQRINSKLHEAFHLNPNEVKQIVKASNYDNNFYGRLGSLERNIERGSYPADFTEYLRNGKKQEPTKVEIGESRLPRYEPIEPNRNQPAHTMLNGFEQSINNLSRAITPRTRT